MIHFSAKSHVHRLVTVLSFVGEYPVHSLYLLGKERVMKELVHRLTAVQMFRNDETGEEHTCRLLTITGKGREKSIRFYKAGLVILGWVRMRMGITCVLSGTTGFRGMRHTGNAITGLRKQRLSA